MSHFIKLEFRDNATNETKYIVRNFEPINITNEPYSLNGYFPLYSDLNEARTHSNREPDVIKILGQNHYLAHNNTTYYGDFSDDYYLEGTAELINDVWQTSDNLYIKESITRDISQLGDYYNLVLKTKRGSNNKTLTVANRAGLSNARSFPENVDVYSRHDIILYICDDYGDSTASVTDVPTDYLYDLSILNSNTSYNKEVKITSSGIQEESWEDFSNEILTGDGNRINALQRMLYSLQSTKARGSSVIYTKINNTRFRDAVSQGTNLYNYYLNNISSNIADLMNHFVQARLRMVILNFGRRELRQSYVNDVTNFINNLRADINVNELPVIITKYDFMEQAPLGIIPFENETIQVSTGAYIAESLAEKSPNEDGLTAEEICLLGDEYAGIVKDVLEPRADMLSLNPTFWWQASDSELELATSANAIRNLKNVYSEEYVYSLKVNSGFNDLDINTSSFDQPVLQINNSRLTEEMEGIFETDDQSQIKSGAFFAVLNVGEFKRSYLYISHGGGQRFLSHLFWEDQGMYFDTSAALGTARVWYNDTSFVNKNALISFTFDELEGLTLAINGTVVDQSIGSESPITLGSSFTFNGSPGQNDWSVKMALAEMATFSYYIPNGKRYAIEANLATKWNIKLPDSHPFAKY